jgi:hypothetical protein
MTAEIVLGSLSPAAGDSRLYTGVTCYALENGKLAE